MTVITFTVLGTPVQQGSTKAWVNPNTGRANVTHDNKAPLRSWRQDVAARAQDAGCTIVDGPIRVEATFRFLRPPSVSVKKRPLPTTRPDADKLARALLDALTGVAFKDDAQVVSLVVNKLYADQPGLTCKVGPAVPVPVYGEAEQPAFPLEAVGS